MGAVVSVSRIVEQEVIQREAIQREEARGREAEARRCEEAAHLAAEQARTAARQVSERNQASKGREEEASES